MGKYICVNGEIVSREEAVIPANDQGLLYGYGLFETMRVLGGRPVFLDKHLRRLENSAAEIGLQIAGGKKRLTAMLKDTIEANRLENGSLRLTVTAGPLPGEFAGKGGGNVIVTVRPGEPYQEKFYREGFKAGFLKTRRNERSPLVRLKTLNYLENILGRREAARRGWNEGLFLNNAGCLCEGTVSNLFLVFKGKLVTPHVDSGLLPGTVRGVVVELACQMGIGVEERPVLPEELEKAEEAFLTNSLMGVMPLVNINGYSIGSNKPGSLTKKFMAKYEQILKKESQY